MYEGALYNRLFLYRELVRRGSLSSEVADALMCMTVGDLCRMGKLGKEFLKKNEPVMRKALGHIKRGKAYCSWLGRKRMELFLCLAGNPTSFWFHFWAKLFR